MSYDNWRKRLAVSEQHKTVKERNAAIAALRINFMTPTEADVGYYRKPVTEKMDNGRNRVLGYDPVAYFIDNDQLVCLYGLDERQVDAQDQELWSWVVSHPITYEVYKAVVFEGKPWPELEPSPEIGLPNATDPHEAYGAPRLTDNASAEIVKTAADWASEINALVAELPKKAITSNEQAAEVLGLKNRLAEKRLAADKAGKAIYEPLYRDYKDQQSTWSAPVKVASDAEAKIDSGVKVWREAERQRVVAEQAAAAQALAEEAERNQRAADRAIERGEEPPEPEIDETIVYPTAAPERIVPTYGTRTVKEELKTFVTITDETKVAAYFRGNPEVVTVLQTLAERAIKLGQEVPGTTTRQGII
ncbi:hypothetical protein [Sphingomonas sp.]|uniref:hypothetical protein n=1 Tax=Sphingomonas sp. TaxID=28214 RepID=UPI0025DB9658|nr:hypothetical protein [Sphingomonas sp.]